MTDVKFEVVRWARPSTKTAGESGWRPALVKFGGHKWLQLVHFSDGGNVTVSKIPVGEERFFQPLLHKGNPYPVERAVRIFLRRPKAKITKGARAILEEARS